MQATTRRSFLQHALGGVAAAAIANQASTTALAMEPIKHNAPPDSN